MKFLNIKIKIKKTLWRKNLLTKKSILYILPVMDCWNLLVKVKLSLSSWFIKILLYHFISYEKFQDFSNSELMNKRKRLHKIYLVVLQKFKPNLNIFFSAISILKNDLLVKSSKSRKLQIDLHTSICCVNYQ